MKLFNSSLRLIFYFFLTTTAMVSLADELGSKQHPIQVGVLMDMPFAQNINGHYSGIAVDIWDRIAKLNHWEYRYIPLNSDNMESVVDTLASTNKLDVVIGPVSVSAKRLEKIDFSRPFYLSSIGVIIKKHELGIFDIAKILVSKNLLHIIIALILSFTGYLTLLWLFEHKKVKNGLNNNHLQYPSLTQRIWLHLFQKKVDYMPVTTQGRVIGIFWIIIAAAIFTAINANFTSALTIARYENAHRSGTLEGLQVSGVAGITGEFDIEVAEKNGIPVTPVKDMQEAIRLLEKDKVAGVVSDTPVAMHYLRQHNLNDLTVSPVTLENDEISFAVKLNSPLRHAIDLGISSFQDDDSVVPLCRRYVGEQANRCDL